MARRPLEVRQGLKCWSANGDAGFRRVLPCHAIKDPRSAAIAWPPYTLSGYPRALAGPRAGFRCTRLAGPPRLILASQISSSLISRLALIGVSSGCPLAYTLREIPLKMAARRLVEISAIGAGLSDKSATAWAPNAFLQACADLGGCQGTGARTGKHLPIVGVAQGKTPGSPSDLESGLEGSLCSGITVHDVKCRPLMAPLAPHTGASSVRALFPRTIRNSRFSQTG